MTHKAGTLLSAYRNNLKIRSGTVFLILTGWVVILSASDSFLSTSVVCALAGMLAFVRNAKRGARPSARGKTCGIIFSAAAALAVFLANYRLVFPIGEHPFRSVLFMIVLLAGGYLISWHVLLLASETHIRKACPGRTVRTGAKRWFLAVFLGVACLDLLALFCCWWPGFLTPDSISQIGQNLTGKYSNHHPFWHTMIIRLLMDTGMAVFGEINSAVAVYSVFQILCMAAVFAYMCMTLYEAGFPKGWIVAAAAACAVLPYHMQYSMTMWKDILFAGSVTLFVCALYRALKGIGAKGMNCFVLAAGALGCCLLRSNGLAAFALTFVLLAAALRKKEKRILVMLLAVIAVSFVMKHPVLKILDVDQPDTAEFLSIPEQQIARLIADDADLDREDLLMAERIMDTRAVKAEYEPHISDPVKDIIRETGQDYLNEHKQEYLALWLRLGLRYPGPYLKAWIDQTRGYWNGGYSYWVVAPGVHENDFGIGMPSRGNIVFTVLNGWSYLFFHSFLFQPFISIGLHVWMAVLCGMVCIVRKRKEGLLCVLPLAVILSLLISTPVFSEFRYAYAVFASFPLLALSALAAPEKDANSPAADDRKENPDGSDCRPDSVL